MGLKQRLEFSSSPDRDGFTPSPKLTQYLNQDLSETFHWLSGRTDRIVHLWCDLYLSAFHRKPFFSEQRVRRIFEELAAAFMDCLKKSDITRYMQQLTKSGKSFFELGVPFEEVLLCIHLFQESCRRLIISEHAIGPRLMTKMQFTFDELGRIGTSAFALSYFRSVKLDWERICDAYRIESENIRSEMDSLREDWYSSTKHRITAIELAMTSMNRKLRINSIQFGQIQKMMSLLCDVREASAIVKISSKFYLDYMPKEAELMIGLWSDSMNEIQTYGWSNDELFDAIIASGQLLPEHQVMLSNATHKPMLKKNINENAKVIMPLSTLKVLKEYVFIPLVRYGRTLGFVWIASQEQDRLTKSALKYYLRLSKPLAFALSGYQYTEVKEREQALVRWSEEATKQPRKESMDEAIDHYLGLLIDMTRVDRASVMLLDSSARKLRLFAAKGERVFPFSGTSFRMGQGICGQSLKDEKTLCVSHWSLQKDNTMIHRLSHLFHKSKEAPIKSLACIPLVYENHKLGVLNMSTLYYQKTFSDSELEIARHIASQLSQLIWERSNASKMLA